MTQNTQQIQRPNTSGPQKDRNRLVFGLKCALATTALVGGMVFLGTWQRCRPKSEGISKKPVPAKVCEEKTCPPLPAPTNNKDKKCEPGENNPYSDKYDPACGYCGDGEQQVGETKENCPVDFLCEKGNERYWRAPFAAFKPIDDGKLELTIVKVTKNCKPGDKPSGMRPSMRHDGMKPEMQPDMTEKPMVVTAGGPCPTQPSGELTGIRGSIVGTVMRKTAIFWANPAVARNKAHNVNVRLSVSGGGTITGVSVSAAGQSFSAGSLGLNRFVGRSIGYSTGASCYINVAARIPAGTI